MALIMALFNVTMVTHSFYWVQCELVQGAAYTFVYLALIENVVITSRISARFILLAPLLAITMVFTYPLLPFVFLFGLAFLYLTYRKKNASSQPPPYPTSPCTSSRWYSSKRLRCRRHGRAKRTSSSCSPITSP